MAVLINKHTKVTSARVYPAPRHVPTPKQAIGIRHQHGAAA